MLWKEIAELEDCEKCPLYINEICPGGFTSSPSGEPVEPPCCGFDDDTDLDKWVSDYYERQKRYENYLDAKYKKEQEKLKKANIAKQKRTFLKNYCYSEQYEVKRLKKKIKALENSIEFAESLVSAINITNEMFGYAERKQVDPIKNEELYNLQKELQKAEETLKNKQKEGRKTPKYKEIGR